MQIYFVYILRIVLHIYMQKNIEYVWVQYFFAYQTTFEYAEYSAYGCAPLL